MLGSGLHIKAQMVHSIGADDHGMFSVFEGCRLERNGSLEMHRWTAGAVADTLAAAGGGRMGSAGLLAATSIL